MKKYLAIIALSALLSAAVSCTISRAALIAYNHPKIQKR